MNKAIRNKPGLQRGNKLMEKRFKARENFGNHLVNDITKANRSKMRGKSRIVFLGDEGDISVIERFKEKTR